MKPIRAEHDSPLASSTRAGRRGAGSRFSSTASLLGSLAPPVALFAIVLCAWQGACVYWQIEKYLLPRPTQVFAAAWENREELARATWLTAEASLSGFGLSLVVGMLLAMLFSQSKVLERAVYPYAIFLQTVPVVAVAPIIVVWLGYGFRSVLVVSLMVSLFPIIAGASAGLTLIDSPLVELFTLHNASRLQTLWKLRLPHALPYVVTAAKTSCGLAVIGAIVGEFFIGYDGGSHALGYVITLASHQLKMDLLFAAVGCSTLLGVGMFTAASFVGSVLLLRWRYSPREEVMDRQEKP